MHLTDFIIYFSVLVMGVAGGIAVRNTVKDLDEREKLANKATVFGIFTLLPIHIILSGFVATKLTTGVVLILSVSAVALYLMCYWISGLQRNLPWVKDEIYPGVRYISCTFGGGNRGVLLLTAVTLLLGRLTHFDQSTLLDAFATFDIAYFLFFMVAGQGWQMRRDFRESIDANSLFQTRSGMKGGDASRQDLLDWYLKYRGPMLIGGAVLIAVAIRNSPQWNMQQVDGVDLNAVRSALSAIISFVAAFQITLAFKRGVNFDVFSSYVYVAYSSRLISSVIIFLIGQIIGLPPTTQTLLTFSLFIMTFVPPSSLLEGLMGELGIPLSAREEITTVNGLLNLIFIYIVVFLITLAVILNLLGGR